MRLIVALAVAGVPGVVADARAQSAGAKYKTGLGELEKKAS